MLAEDDKLRLTDVASTEQLLRLILSIPSKKRSFFFDNIEKDQIKKLFWCGEILIGFINNVF